MDLNQLQKILTGNSKVLKNYEVEAIALAGKPRDADKKCIAYALKKQYADQVMEQGVESIICSEELSEYVQKTHNGGILVSEDPVVTCFEIHNHLAQVNKATDKKTFIDPSAVIEEGAVISNTNVYIGKNVHVESLAVIKDHVTIGDNSTVMNGAVLGTPAFYYFGSGNDRKRVTSVGDVVIGKNVSIHTNVSVEKGVLGGSTVIDDNTIVDQCLVIGHDAKVGKNCTIVVCSLIAGWVVIGDNTFVGGCSAIAHGIKIGSHCKISMGSVVTKDVADGRQVTGNFAIDHGIFIKNLKRQIEEEI